MGVPFPRMNLDSLASPWGRAIQNRLEALEDSFRRSSQSQGNAGRASTSAMATVSGQVKTLQQTTSTLKGVTDTLTAMQEVDYAEWQNANGVTTGAVGWMSTPASVQVSSPTGRLEVEFGGSLNSGNGYFVYNIVGPRSGTVVSRETVRNNPAQRVGCMGGASFVGSGSKSVVVSVPKNEVLTVSVEVFSANTTTYLFGASIRARVTP